jgi:hypothetical protein
MGEADDEGNSYRAPRADHGPQGDNPVRPLKISLEALGDRVDTELLGGGDSLALDDGSGPMYRSRRYLVSWRSTPPDDALVSQFRGRQVSGAEFGVQPVRVIERDSRPLEGGEENPAHLLEQWRLGRGDHTAVDLVHAYDATWPQQAGHVRERGRRIRQVHQDEASGDGVEQGIRFDVSDIALKEAVVPDPGPRLRGFDGAGAAFDPDDLTGRPHDPGDEHRDIGCPGAQIEHALPGAIPAAGRTRSVTGSNRRPAAPAVSARFHGRPGGQRGTRTHSWPILSLAQPAAQPDP